MDFKQWNDDRNRLFYIIDEELQNFNDRLERNKLNIHPSIKIQDWTRREFYEFSKELQRVLQSVTQFMVNTKVSTEVIGRIIDSEHTGNKIYEISKCFVYFDGQFLTSFAIRY